MIGRAARLGGRISGGARNAAFGTLIAGSVAGGVGSALLDDEGPWGTVAETMTGSRDFGRYSVRAGLSSAVTRNRSVTGVEDYYYGRPTSMPYVTNRSRTRERLNQVPGETVFGMYNMRR